jgi:ribosomal protein S18 acetylase RimI-like enzyme
MTVRRMTPADLSMVLAWAAREGWNPGIDDADAFHAADPDGFFLNEVDGRPAAAVSVVNHDDRFAFLGLYICDPAYRGRGHGFAVWEAGLAHAGGRCVGLDGVPAQQANYESSGFVRQGRTVRYRAAHTRQPLSHATGHFDRQSVVAADIQASGILRTRYAEGWFLDTQTRRTLCLDECAPSEAFATYRVCQEGVKIGPFHAREIAGAEALLDCVPKEFGEGPLFLDVPESSIALTELLERRGFEPVFDTARMYSGTPPVTMMPSFYAVTTLELG